MFKFLFKKKEEDVKIYSLNDVIEMKRDRYDEGYREGKEHLITMHEHSIKVVQFQTKELSKQWDMLEKEKKDFEEHKATHVLKEIKKIYGKSTP